MKFDVEIKIKGFSRDWIFHVQNIVKDSISEKVSFFDVDYDGEFVVAKGFIDCVNSRAADHSVETMIGEIKRRLEKNEDFVNFDINQMEIKSNYARVFEDHE